MARVGGVPQDYVEAVHWYRLAADQGDVDAQFNLGYFMYKGLGVKPDHKEALVWLRKASAQGSEEAKTFLSEIGE
ncbi:tetratricopeptide repeat protein [Porphyromonas sp.]|uniref:tetratricopeptide repeat protein n=1 Tax=Porphyromonas sp. TaxID=1924944 RepID=UPI001CAFDF88|nr:sel1 repeat family protein [Porphyromonas sp.]